MSLYHQAAYTLDPEFTIPAEAAPAALDETGQADELAAYSETHGEGKIALVGTALSGTYLTVTLDYYGGSELPEGSEVEWLWGDGSSEVGHDTLQGHPYAGGGDFHISAILRRPGQASLERSLLVSI